MKNPINSRSARPQNRKPKWILAAFIALAATFLTSAALAQQLTGTLSGTVYDQSGAVIPNAQVVLKNQLSGDTRTAVSGGDGHFVITAVQPAAYSITVSATGFSSWQENDIVMNVGDTRDVPNIKLNVGGNATQVNVVAGADAIVPTDTAEISTSLNTQMINDFPLQGRDAGELLKIMPGMAMNTSQASGGFNDRIIGSNNGPVGDYSANGTQPNGAMAYMLDGANLVDPGNFGTQIANINQDMVASVKVLMSNYGAEYAKGPTIFQAFSKSGGSQFHGEGYLYTHNASLNSVDAFTKSQGGNNAAQSYYYVGGNVGGPILLPWVKYNRDRKKLFFWAGYEYMKQQPAGSIINYNVPNAAQLAGDFSNPGIPAEALTTWPKFYDQLAQNVPAGGTATSFPISDIDPNIAGILNLYPKTNEAPSAANGYNNYRYVNTSPQNRWEATGKVDYAISDNDKVTGSYAYQKEADLAPISIWWATPNTLPYPTPGASNTVTYIILTNYTHVFSPTTTNEFVFTWSHFVNPYALADPAKVSRSTNNFNVQGLFGNTTDQIPNFEPDYCCSEQLASINYYPMSTGTFGGIKQVPAFYDNFTKVIAGHTLKGGFYWDSSENNQNANSANNGTYNFQTYGSNSTTNLVADMMLGYINSYAQQNVNVPQNTKYHQWSLYAQDSWKASRSLTINYGLRFDHIGQWYGYPNGMQVWDPGSYVNSANAPANTGLLWHAINPKIPLSGFVSPLFYYAPRVGFAYDIFGTGKTVFRGGFAVYRYQATSETASAGAGPAGSFQYTTPTVFNGYTGIANFTPPSSVNQNGVGSYNTVYAMQQGDNRAPFTNNWNATVSQALPRRTVFEVSYIGNRSANEYLDGSNSNLYNLNNVSPGGLFALDPNPNSPGYGKYVSPSAPGCSTTNPANQSIYCENNPGAYTPTYNANDFRPLQQYGNFYLLTHLAWQNYNSLQVSVQKQSGPVTFVANYTFGKVLGVRDGGSNNGAGNGTGIDPFNPRNDYGPLAYDHTNILNFTYNWKLPSPIHGDGLGMKLAGGAVNGWQVSGYNAFQSGAPLQWNLSANMNAIYASGLTVPTVAHPDLPDNSIKMPNGLVSTSVNTSTWFGSNAYNDLIPALTCNPLSGLHKVASGDGKQGMRFNPACFTTPAYGQQGPTNYPYMRLPNYWDSDLGIYKSFHITDTQYIQFKASATNWLNHPLGQFGLANNSDNALNFQQTTPATCGSCAGLNVVSIAPTNQSTSVTGAPAFKTGSRFVTLALKYYF